ncbi:hypothetical protein ACFCV3_09105 [Kribbella sp. NPDC056345]|uniref:hypothetical protein n=1 Tax=Kribbella sp. NPDC056345 TaxID=3345789 RepID=UPI0035DFCAD5
MRKIALAVTAVAALSAGLQTPAFAAVPDAPTDVKISWADSNNIKLTWVDTDLANSVFWQFPGGNELKFADVTSTAPNEFLVPKSIFSRNVDKMKLIVKSSNADGASAPAPSAEFDTFLPAVPALKDANLVAVSTASISWTLAAVADQTPGDPLDVAGPGSVKANIDLPGTATNSHTFAAGQTSGVLPPVARPAAIRLSAVNEWGESAQDAKVLRVGSLAAGITVPARAVYGARLAIKSTLDLFTSEGREERASGIKVELQARAKSTDAWKTYGRYAGNTTAAFDTGIASLGNRQYRLLVPARKIVGTNVIALTPATSTSAKSSTTLTKFISAGFTPAVANRGANVDLSARISPASTVKARLQFWDGRSWFDAGPLQFNKGYALQHGSAGDEPGSARFRITVPAVLVNGLTVSATTSSAFTLTVR